jgi:hypothetical protein
VYDEVATACIPGDFAREEYLLTGGGPPGSLPEVECVRFRSWQLDKYIE